MNNSYKCCMVTPGQTSSAGFSDRENRCVTVVPPQEEGYMMADGYRFSDGYSMDYEQLKNYAPMQSTFQCDPTLYGGSGHYTRGEMPEVYHQQHFYNATYPEHYGNFQGCQEVMGTEVLPQVCYSFTAYILIRCRLRGCLSRPNFLRQMTPSSASHSTLHALSFVVGNRETPQTSGVMPSLMTRLTFARSLPVALVKCRPIA